jgi:hypothetical protein
MQKTPGRLIIEYPLWPHFAETYKIVSKCYDVDRTLPLGRGAL